MSSPCLITPDKFLSVAQGAAGDFQFVLSLFVCLPSSSSPDILGCAVYQAGCAGRRVRLSLHAGAGAADSASSCAAGSDRRAGSDGRFSAGGPADEFLHRFALAQSGGIKNLVAAALRSDKPPVS